jgi:hypothetical protein
MAALVDADPGLDPDDFFDNWPSDLWSALVFQVIGQELSLAAAGAIRAGSRHCTTAGGGSMARCRSPRWTLSGTASGRGARGGRVPAEDLIRPFVRGRGPIRLSLRRARDSGDQPLPALR